MYRWRFFAALYGNFFYFHSSKSNIGQVSQLHCKLSFPHASEALVYLSTGSCTCVCWPVLSGLCPVMCPLTWGFQPHPHLLPHSVQSRPHRKICQQIRNWINYFITWRFVLNIMYSEPWKGKCQTEGLVVSSQILFSESITFIQ